MTIKKDQNPSADQELTLVRKITGSIFNKYSNRNNDLRLTFEDCYHEGVIGLLEAKKRYDKEKGVPWLAFASIRIRGNIIDFLSKSNPIRIPKQKYYKIKRLKQAQIALFIQKGESNSQLLANQLGWTKEEVEDVHNLAISFESIEHTDTYFQNETPSFTIVKDGQPTPESFFANEEIADLVHHCLLQLSSRKHRIVLILRVLEGCSLKDIAQTFKCSIETIRQYQKKASIQLKNCIVKQEEDANIEERG